MSDIEDITPANSVAPVFLDSTPLEPVESDPFGEPDVDALRLAAYREAADPLYFKWQRGEATEQAWLDAVAAIRERYPKHDA